MGKFAIAYKWFNNQGHATAGKYLILQMSLKFSDSFSYEVISLCSSFAK